MSEITDAMNKLSVDEAQKPTTLEVLKVDNPSDCKSPMDLRFARRRLSVIRGEEDEGSVEHFKLDGQSEAKSHIQHNRRGSMIDTQHAPVFARYAASSKVGHVPFNPHKVNQDRACKVLNFGGDDEKVFFGVFDGHGSLGHDVSQFVSTKLPNFMLKQENLDSNPPAAISEAFLECNRALTKGPIDCTFSGTTAIVCYLHGKKLYSCNAGDSRAVLGKKVGEKLVAVPLSSDHKPDRLDERKRILDAKGRVETCKGNRGEAVGPLRVWLLRQDVPGLAMTRSFGDLIAASVGVVARPEVWYRDIEDDDEIMILASDGVWEFITNQEAVSMIAHCESPEEACQILVDESTKRWMQEEEVIDDITAMVVFFKPRGGK